MLFSNSKKSWVFWGVFFAVLASPAASFAAGEGDAAPYFYKKSALTEAIVRVWNDARKVEQEIQWATLNDRESQAQTEHRVMQSLSGALSRARAIRATISREIDRGMDQKQAMDYILEYENALSEWEQVYRSAMSRVQLAADQISQIEKCRFDRARMGGVRMAKAW